LTEEPEAEVPVAKALVDRYKERRGETIPEIAHYPLNPFDYTRRHTHVVGNLGGHQVPRVIADFSRKEIITPASLFGLGYHYSVPLDKWNISDVACDYLFLGDRSVSFGLPGTLALICHHATWVKHRGAERGFPLIPANEYLGGVELSDQLNFISVGLRDCTPGLLDRLRLDPTAVLVIDTRNEHGMAEQRRIFVDLMNGNCPVPVVIRRFYENLMPEHLQVYAATDFGGLFIDGLGDGIFIAAENCGGDKIVNDTAFNILQATRTRISKTEYISCPSCGRTLFDLVETTGQIRSRTHQLKGVKIAIMGCIVNGPGEMADADYGYVGSGPGRVTLYRGKDVVKRNVPTANAVDELIGLIREDGNWVEATVTANVD
jgi:(E)-4-hydroxy-3-methylbut-2-enyl-diphosphate synthase